VVSIRKDRVGQPFAGTQRLVMHGVPKTGPALYLYTYLLPLDVTLQVTSPISPEPEWISAWATSCRREQGGTSEGGITSSCSGRALACVPLILVVRRTFVSRASLK